MAKEALQLDEVRLGLLWASLSVGLMAMTLWMIGAPQRELCRRLWMIAAAAAVGGAATYELSRLSSFFIALMLVAAIGATSGLVHCVCFAPRAHAQGHAGARVQRFQ
jgi:MFS transporter, DHA3 family, macrolide efflux protein